ncbi:protein FAR1-RELATED SEQUENCE 5-like [Oryza brachyantha]|uniref:SWIM-type domain-containing protein n=1 Tax=Oryza brachyantha TaxID=4533 RepID=J3NBK9_ORYBR|nr:protein FAR1-RELATED SEQUENCE 5-like [Oryza brachyantha]
MEDTSIAIEIDGEAICLDSVGDNEEQGSQENQEIQIIYDAESEGQVAFDNEEQGGQEHTARNGEEDQENIPVIPSREELTEELRNKIANSEEEAYRLYCDYGHRMGFSVRKGKQYYFTGTKTIRTKDYYCSKEGLKDDEQLTEANFNKPDTRTNCKAMVRFRVDSEGHWRVIQIVPEHNHELVRPEEVHLLRSVRTLSIPKPGVLNAMVNAEIQAMHDNLHMNDDGAECRAQLSIQSYKLLEPEDSESLVGYFKHRTIEQGMFYWDVQVEDGRMTNFFWRDGRSRIDYDCFGDVMVFDTTCRTSKYNMICAPFVGVNHHGQNVIFGCAFLLDESSTSYEWLFKSFLDSMGGRPPKTIFTVKDETISKVIDGVFPETHHCICEWSIENTLQSHLGTLNDSGTFHSMFKKCMRECESEAEFEETWALMLDKCNIQDHQWLADLYQQRRKWCTALHKDAFDGGINSHDRSDSSNNALSSIADESTPPNQFILEFDKLVGSWRTDESAEDIQCNQTSPDCTIKHSSILQHAAEIYTRKVYKSLEMEYLDGCNGTSYQEIQCSETLYRFEFILQRIGPKVCIVFLDTSSMELNCSCKKFETMGILCSHAINALDFKNIDRLPERYISKRWTKYVRRGTYLFPADEFLGQDFIEPEPAFRNKAMRFVYDLLMKSKGHQDTRKLILDMLENGEKTLESVCELRRLNAHPSGRDKDGSKVEKRKKKSAKQDKSSRNVRQAVLSQTTDTVLVDPPNQNQYYAAEDIATNSSIGRPFFYQGYPAAGVSTSQIQGQGHTNMHSVPQCAPQEYSAYGPVHPPTFGSGRNF